VCHVSLSLIVNCVVKYGRVGAYSVLSDLVLASVRFEPEAGGLPSSCRD